MKASFFFTAATLAAIMSGAAGGVGDYSLWSITYLLYMLALGKKSAL